MTNARLPEWPPDSWAKLVLWLYADKIHSEWTGKPRAITPLCPEAEELIARLEGIFEQTVGQTAEEMYRPLFEETP